MIKNDPLSIFVTTIAVPIKNLFRSILMILVIFSGWSVSVVQAAALGPLDFDFYQPRDDKFWSMGKFSISFSPTFGGGSTVVDLSGPTCVARSVTHDQGIDPSGDLGDGSLCEGSPGVATSDAEIEPIPFYFNSGLGKDEVHTEILEMSLTDDDHEFTLTAGKSVSGACPQQRSLGEVESRSNLGGFHGKGAESFFNLFLEVGVDLGDPFGHRFLYNPFPLTVWAEKLKRFPPYNKGYIHGFDLSGSVRLYDCETGCFVATVKQGSHGVGGGSFPSLARPRMSLPIVFSVDENAEGLVDPLFDPPHTTPSCHPSPQAVFILDYSGERTEGELFQSSGFDLGASPDVTNANRKLRRGLGLVQKDNIISLSFGEDSGKVLLFSVDPKAQGAPRSAVEYNSIISPVGGPALTGPVPPNKLPSNAGGDRDDNNKTADEAAGDIYVSYKFSQFGPPPPPITSDECKERENAVVAAPELGTNVMGYDESSLGLQAPAVRHSVNKGPSEDDLDALEASDADLVDSNRDGVVDPNRFVFFSLSPNSPSLGTDFKANDILVATAPAIPDQFTFDIYAHGIDDIRLLEGDVIDALVLWDSIPHGTLDENEDSIKDGWDEILFSLAAGSPSLQAGANPNMPGIGPFSPGDVFRIKFRHKEKNRNKIRFYAKAAELGLKFDDELDALDIAPLPTPFKPCLVTLVDDSFAATASNGSMTLTWESAAEVDNAGFFVWRGQLKAGKVECSLNVEDYTEVKQLNSILVPAKGDGSLYSYEDQDVTSGNTYCYVLEDVELDGKRYDDKSHLSDPILASMP